MSKSPNGHPLSCECPDCDRYGAPWRRSAAPPSEEVERRTEIPDFLKRQTGELPPLEFPKWRDDEGREGRREGAEEDQDLVPLTPQMARAQADLYTEMKARAEAAEARNTLLQALVGEKDAALAPFAAAAGRFHETRNDDCELWQCPNRVDYITIGDIRRAFAALQKSEASE